MAARNFLPRCIAFFNWIPIELLRIRTSNTMHLGKKFLAAIFSVIVCCVLVIEDSCGRLLNVGQFFQDPRCQRRVLHCWSITYMLRNILMEIQKHLCKLLKKIYTKSSMQFIHNAIMKFFEHQFVYQVRNLSRTFSFLMIAVSLESPSNNKKCTLPPCLTLIMICSAFMAFSTVPTSQGIGIILYTKSFTRTLL